MSTVFVESKDGISYIYLNRPEKYNAIDLEMLADLYQVIEQVEMNEDRVVIISGKGAAFSAGGDVNMLQENSEKEDFEKIMVTIEKIVLKLYMMPKIIVSAIQGSAVGLGLSLALTADYVIAQSDAKLGVLFMGIGLAPDGGGHFFLSERLGVHKAKQFTWGLQQVTGKEAKEMGLVDIVTSGDVLEDATEQAQQLLAAPMIAMLKTKLMYHQEKRAQLEYYLQEERESQWELRNTEDHKEGVAAFIDKRFPTFKGK